MSDAEPHGQSVILKLYHYPTPSTMAMVTRMVKAFMFMG